MPGEGRRRQAFSHLFSMRNREILPSRFCARRRQDHVCEMRRVGINHKPKIADMSRANKQFKLFHVLLRCWPCFVAIVAGLAPSLALPTHLNRPSQATQGVMARNTVDCAGFQGQRDPVNLSINSPTGRDGPEKTR